MCWLIAHLGPTAWPSVSLVVCWPLQEEVRHYILFTVITYYKRNRHIYSLKYEKNADYHSSDVKSNHKIWMRTHYIKNHTVITFQRHAKGPHKNTIHIPTCILFVFTKRWCSMLVHLICLVLWWIYSVCITENTCKLVTKMNLNSWNITDFCVCACDQSRRGCNSAHVRIWKE